jgi:superfamily I DNA and/or RNA helicase
MNIDFPILILDEASQMLETTSLLPLCASKAKKMLIVGDPLQLPPTMASSTNATEPVKGESSYIDRTLFDRLYNNDFRVTMLRTQYRCHPKIAGICSQLFYSNNVIHGVQAADRAMHPTFRGLSPVNAMHCQGQEMRRFDSYVNETEALYIKELVNFFLTKIKDGDNDDNSNPVPNYSIGVICLYKAQSYIIANLVGNGNKAENPNPNLVVATVDSFQGSEMGMILLLLLSLLLLLLLLLLSRYHNYIDL